MRRVCSPVTEVITAQSKARLLEFCNFKHLFKGLRMCGTVKSAYLRVKNVTGHPIERDELLNRTPGHTTHEDGQLIYDPRMVSFHKAIQ